ncbi:MAG: PP2C family protein-serine/threonine phosphatase, partial [Opitutaceae bacterium]
FDIVQLSDTQCGVLVCDVMGHGVRAGLLTAMIRGVVEEMGARAIDPVHVLAEINHSLVPIVEQIGQPVFATTFFGVIDTARHRLTYGNAGHPAPLVRHARSEPIARLAPADPEPAAGLLAEFAYTRHECEFHPGDLFLGYTDGVVEAANSAGTLFGEERLRALLTGARGLSGAELNERLLADVKSFSGHANFDDDVCLVAIEAR